MIGASKNLQSESNARAATSNHWHMVLATIVASADSNHTLSIAADFCFLSIDILLLVWCIKKTKQSSRSSFESDFDG